MRRRHKTTHTQHSDGNGWRRCACRNYRDKQRETPQAAVLIDKMPASAASEYISINANSTIKCRQLGGGCQVPTTPDTTHATLSPCVSHCTIASGTVVQPQRPTIYRFCALCKQHLLCIRTPDRVRENRLRLNGWPRRRQRLLRADDCEATLGTRLVRPVNDKWCV